LPVKPVIFIISSLPSSSSWLRELTGSNYHAKIFLICDDFVAKTTDMMENARGNQRPQVEAGTWRLDCIFVLNLTGTYHIVGLCHLEQVDGEAGHMF